MNSVMKGLIGVMPLSPRIFGLEPPLLRSLLILIPVPFYPFCLKTTIVFQLPEFTSAEEVMFSSDSTCLSVCVCVCAKI